MAEIAIPLSQGLVGLVDEGDAAFASLFKWHAIRSGHTFYVVRNCRALNGHHRTTVRLSRELLNAPGDMQVDHINGDGLDNRRSNLRLATCAQNQRNQRPQTGVSSRYRGVCWDKSSRQWHTMITVAGRRIFLGRFADEADAARVYDDAARLHHGEFARPNFPTEQE